MDNATLMTVEDATLMTQDVALILRKSPETIRLYERTGKLTAKRTPGGRRLYSESQVKALAAELAAKKARHE